MKRLTLASIILGHGLLVLAGCAASMGSQQMTLPPGPFLAYNKQGKLVSTIYMIPIKDIEAHEKFEDLGVAKGMTLQRVELYYNAGHPGVAEPHYHIILWYVGEAEQPK